MDQLIAGERSPKLLAQFARTWARRKIAELEEALEGAEFFTAGHAALLATMLARIDQLTASIDELTAVIESMTVSEFIDDYLFRARHQSFPVTGDGTDTVCGLVTLDRIKHVPAGQRDRTRLADIACPLADVANAAPENSVADLLPRLTECADRRALVFSDGHLAGVITPSDITRMMDRLSAAQPRHGPTGRAASQGRMTSAAIAGASTHRRLFTISTFTSIHQFRLRDSEPRRLEHASAAVDCLAAPGT